MQNHSKYKNVLLSIAYFPPIIYFSKLIKYENIFLEKYENYKKQSYRNRCVIYGANGLQTLSIPVKKISGKKIKITDVEIDYTNDWQKNHFRSIDSAYRSSPFYEFYIDAFKIFFSKKYKYLFDMNLEIIRTVISEIEETKNINFTKKFVFNTDLDDFREAIHPKNKIHNVPDFYINEYTQVFSEKFGFKENLSILDLLFNEGTTTVDFF